MARVPAAISLSYPKMHDGTVVAILRIKPWAEMAIGCCLAVLRVLVKANILTADEAAEKAECFAQWLLSL